MQISFYVLVRLLSINVTKIIFEIRTYVCNYNHIKQWDEITHPVRKFNDGLDGIWLRNRMPYKHIAVITYVLIYFSESGPW